VKLKRLRLPLVGATVLLTIVCAPAGSSPPPWTALATGVLGFLLFGSIEPVLVALLSIGAGTLCGAALGGAWVAEPCWFAGTTTVVPVVAGRLARFRGQGTRVFVACTALALAFLAFQALLVLNPAPVVPPLVGLVLAHAGMDVLLFMDNRRGAPRLYSLAGAAFAFLHLLTAQMLLLVAAAPLSLLPGGALPRLRRLGRAGARSLCRMFPYGKLDLSGITPEAFRGPAIVISNHQSAVDILLVLALPADVRLTLSPRVWRAPTMGIAARSLGHILVEAENPDATLAATSRTLSEGALVHFFPEGTRSEDAFPARFRRGAFEVASALGCDILPVVLCDTRTCVPRGAFWVERFHMSARALPRIAPRDFDGPRALMKHAQEVVRAAFLEEHARISTPAALRRKVARLYHYQGFAISIAVRRALAREEWLRLVAEAMPARGRVLDVGSGLGVAAHWLAERHPRLRVVGVETDPDRVRVARRSAAGTPRVTFVCGEVPDGPADGALLRADAAGGDALRRLAACLVPGAPLVAPGLAAEPARAAGFLPGPDGVYVRGPSA
jgi:1-acyl-sn-glycerol-3-phosphate acyltransferase